MSVQQLNSVLAPQPREEQQQLTDPYAGFNDYDHAYDLENLYADREFVQAVARSSYGRRPATGARPTATSSGLPLGSSAGLRLSTAAAHSQMGTKRIPATGAARASLFSRARTGFGGSGTASGIRGAHPSELARPMTAVRAAGYTSAGRKSTFDVMPLKPKAEEGSQLGEENAQMERVKKLETQVLQLLRDSVFAQAEGDNKKALDKAKEAARQWRAADALRKSAGEQPNMDLSWNVLLCLGQQKLASNIPSEALHIFQTIVKDRSYVNGHRLRVNIGNIYFRKKDYSKAIKYYRMALDQVPKVHQRMRTKISNNIGVTMVRLGRYEDALSTFEDCLDQGHADYPMALNLTMAAYCLGSEDKMREAFQRLVDISNPAGTAEENLRREEEQEDVLAAQLLNNDALAVWERRKRQQAERTILLAAKIISQAIAPSFSEGYAWCVECIRQSVYASLATELEMNKAVELLRQGQLEQAEEELLAFNSKADNKVASAASNNLALLSIVRGGDKLEDAVQYCEQALSLDRYNANALVNRGNVHYYKNEPQLALQCYREAVQMEAGCIAAIFNSGLVCRSIGQLDEAKRHFFKLNEMLVNNVQVLLQLAEIYEQQGEISQSIELYTQASSLAPTDPAILVRMAAFYEAEGDKAQAFQCHYDSFRHFPPNIAVIRWLGNYYLYAQFAEKAVAYFEKAALMEPNNPEWPMLMAGCQRRSGNFQRAMELYKQVHRRFPNNVECLKFLAQLSKELRMPVEEREYTEKLNRLQKIGQLRAQRESDSAGPGQRQHSSAGSPAGGGSAGMLTGFGSRPGSSRSGHRNSVSATGGSRQAQLQLLEGGQHFQATKRDITAADLAWDPVGSANSSARAPPRPMTGLRRAGDDPAGDVLFEHDDGDDLLPD